METTEKVVAPEPAQAPVPTPREVAFDTAALDTLREDMAQIGGRDATRALDEAFAYLCRWNGHFSRVQIFITNSPRYGVEMTARYSRKDDAGQERVGFVIGAIYRGPMTRDEAIDRLAAVMTAGRPREDVAAAYEWSFHS